MKQIILSVVVSVIVAFLIVVGLKVIAPTTQPTFGNMGDFGGYLSTTTRASPAIYNGIALKESWGTLHSVTFTAPNTGSMMFYDATTSDATKRTGQIATSSLKILASFGPLAMATTTYFLDVGFTNGLLLYYDGTLSTSTITWQ